MRRMRIWTGLAILLALPLLTSCSAAASRPGAKAEGEPPAAASAVPTTDLLDVDASATPDGPAVGDIIAVEDFQDVLGRKDLTLAPAN